MLVVGIGWAVVWSFGVESSSAILLQIPWCVLCFGICMGRLLLGPRLCVRGCGRCVLVERGSGEKENIMVP